MAQASWRARRRAAAQRRRAAALADLHPNLSWRDGHIELSRWPGEEEVTFLGRLLGASRAAILLALEEPASTSQLAAGGSGRGAAGGADGSGRGAAGGAGIHIGLSRLPSPGSRYIVVITRGFPALATEGTMASGYNVRVGDAEREATAAQLREHYADGRLTLDELNERLDQTFAAKTKTDLNAVLADLPYSATAGSSGTGRYGGQALPSPMATRRNWDDGYGNRQGYRGPFAAFAPLMGLVWVFVILGAVSLFGLGGGDRPIAIVLFIAALALFRRIFGLRRGRRCGPRGPRGRPW